ncbi:MAG: hypothetical protein SGJ13_16200 [Actinomycetota bacterium]|nr:hypothetical protein [Actinomycetota bacterium]
MNDPASGPIYNADTASPGRLLEGALHVFDRRARGEHSRRVGLIVGLVAVVASAVAAIASAAGALFLAGAGTTWLKENVSFFEHHPRLGAVVCYAITAITFTTGVVAGRASVYAGRSRPPRV